MSNNIFYTDEGVTKFRNAILNGEIDNSAMEDERNYVKDNYPEDSDDIELKYDAEAEITTASFKGKELFSVDSDGVTDEGGEFHGADDMGLRTMYSDDLTEQDFQKRFASDFIDYKNYFADTYTEVTDEMSDTYDAVNEHMETLDKGFDDVSYENTQGCYYKVTAGDATETFAIHEPRDIAEINEFVKEHGERKQDLSFADAIEVADAIDLTDKERASYMADVVSKDDDFYDVIQDVNKAYEQGKDNKEMELHIDDYGKMNVTGGDFFEDNSGIKCNPSKLDGDVLEAGGDLKSLFKDFKQERLDDFEKELSTACGSDVSFEGLNVDDIKYGSDTIGDNRNDRIDVKLSKGDSSETVEFNLSDGDDKIKERVGDFITKVNEEEHSMSM